MYTINEDHVSEIKSQLPSHDVFYIGNDVGFKLSGIPIGGETFVRQQLQKNIDSTRNVITAIVNKLSSKQEKLLLLLQCIPGRIQHLLRAITPSISREFAEQHDAALRDAVAQVYLPTETSSSCKGKLPTTDWGCVAWNVTSSF